MSIIEQIKAVAQKKSDQLVLVEKDQSYSYRDLLDAAEQVFKQIQAQNLNERPILVFGKNDFLSLAAMLAVNLSGRAYIPVDAHTPFERTEMIVKAAKPSLIIQTTESAPAFVDLFTGSLLAIDFQASAEFKVEDLDITQSVKGNDNNYIIFTSGTTGVPKGVEVSEANLSTFTRWMNEDFCQIENNQVLSQALYSFDLSIFSLYPALTQGGTLISLGANEVANFKLLFERLNRDVINTWISTPSFVDICLLDPSFDQVHHPEMTQFIFCGEELTMKTAKKLLQKFPDATVWNTYGPTEATGAISYVQVTEELLANNSRVPIGFAKAGVHFEIIENEIIIVGDSVAKGYFENPEKTAEAFFELNGEKAYHTGDAGSIDEAGGLHYQGRIDFQVKFNGFRIELQDIEANLLSLEAVEKAVVLPDINDEHKVKALVAILKVDEKFEDKKAERLYTKALKEELSKLIMDYMMPTKFVYIDEFPLNQNAKIDRKLLASQIFGGK